MVEQAAERYWNQVSTSRMKFIRGSIRNVGSDGDDIGDISGRAGDNVILIGCNSSTAFFSSSGTLAVGSWQGTGGRITGATVLLNDTSGTSVNTLSENELVATLAHEIGHAFQLGHSSVQESLMYYRVIQNRERLGQDDYNALTYLYPFEKKDGALGSVLGSCGTIDLNSDDKNGPFDGLGGFALNYLAGLLLILALGFFSKKRQKTFKPSCSFSEN